jgi:hypothetical protein
MCVCIYVYTYIYIYISYVYVCITYAYVCVCMDIRHIFTEFIFLKLYFASLFHVIVLLFTASAHQLKSISQGTLKNTSLNKK